jgi:hypothetical protein
METRIAALQEELAAAETAVGQAQERLADLPIAESQQQGKRCARKSPPPKRLWPVARRW